MCVFFNLVSEPVSRERAIDEGSLFQAAEPAGK